jgi:hypothetical protein
MAQIFLKNETFTVGANGTADSFGATGTTEKLVVAAGATVTADQNIERIELSGASSAYGYSVSGNVVTVKLGTATVATYTVGNGDKTIAFADGSAALVFNKLNDVTLGGKAIATTSGTLTGLTLNAADVSASAAGSTVSSSTTKLTTGADNLVGTSANDTFTGMIMDNSNTLQSGDKIDGGLGTDTLSFDVGNSQKFAITAETAGVENVVIRAQAIAMDTTDNNTASTSEVQIDAQRMVGVNHWENSNSRADLLIEDVRILPTQITKDITIAMVETDPGHVDFGFYFDQYSLRAGESSTTSTLNLQLLDIKGAQESTPSPLKANTYMGIKITVDGKLISIPLTDATGSSIKTTYQAVADAVNAGLKTAGLSDKVVAAVSDSFTRFDSDTSKVVSGGQTIKLTATNALLSNVASWVTAGDQPANSNLYANVSAPNPVSISPKVTSTVILDDVGRGSTGGDLVIGGLSVGDTSNSLGVERFEIEVRDNSKLQTIASTNNTLQEVVIKNGVTSSNSFAYATTTANKGNLTVNGDVPAPKSNSNVDANLPAKAVSANGLTTDYGTTINTSLPGSVAQNVAHGFSDVRIIDGSAMTGNLAFTAEVTARAIAKYMNLVDTAPSASPDSLNGFGTGNMAEFVYKGGAGHDTFVVDINSDVAASRSSLVSSREDFTFNVNGGAGNDAITLRVVNTGDTGNTQNWYNNQDLNNNISIFGGDGNDTITKPGAGDVRIDGGTGNDVIYADNTGAQSVSTRGATGYGNANAAAGNTSVKGAWVFNTTDQVTALAGARNIGDLRSDTIESYNFFNSKVTVTFKGIPVTTTVAGTGFKTTDLEINQAIKSAINNDAVLNKLLVAEDGPANTLVVKSLIDGAMTTADLGITVSNGFALPADITPGLLTTIGAVYGLGANATATSVYAAMTTALGNTGNNFLANGDYVTALANDGASNITGLASVTSSDNLILPGSGNDVVVLGTTTGATIAAASSDTVVIAPGFNNDVVVNFVAGAGANSDAFDFTGLFTGSTATSFGGLTDRSINIGTVVTPAASTEAAAVATLFNANNTAAQEHVYVAVSSHNVGSVYTVSNPVGASNAVATLQGTIDLADTSWLSLTADNFVNSSATNYFLLDGPTGAVVAPVVPVVPVVPGAATPLALLIGSTATQAATTGIDSVTFDVAAAKASLLTTQVKVSGFAPTIDSLQIDLPVANAAITTLAQLNGQQGVTALANGITGQTDISFGNNAAGNVITISLIGLTDLAAVNLTVI